MASNIANPCFRSLRLANRSRKCIMSPIMHRKSSFLQTSTSNAIKETSENPAPAPTGSSNRTDSFLNAIETRRTYYSLKNTSPVPDSRIKQLIDTVITHTPSSHNSQSTRLVVLLKDEHVRMWDMALETLRAVVPADKFAPTEQKVKGMREGYGTILFYEDTDVVGKLQAEYPLYKDKFPTWSEQTNGMHQILLWTALESEGFGCNLQHYNPLIDERISEMWNVSKKWSLKGQMVFGEVTAKPKEKTYQALDERVSFHGL